MQVKAHPSSCIPKPLFVVFCFFFLICWTWFYFFNVVGCIFNYVFPSRRCCLKCLLRGHVICLGLTSMKSPGLSCSWFLTHGWSWSPLLTGSPASLGAGRVPEPGKALKLPSCVVVGWSGSLLATGTPRGEGFGTGVLPRTGSALMHLCHLPQVTALRGQTQWDKVSSVPS